MYLLATSLVKKFLILPRLLSNNGKRLFEYFSSLTVAEVPLQNRRLFRLKHCQIQLRKRQLEIWNKNSIINLKVHTYLIFFREITIYLPIIFTWNIGRIFSLDFSHSGFVPFVFSPEILFAGFVIRMKFQKFFIPQFC